MRWSYGLIEPPEADNYPETIECITEHEEVCSWCAKVKEECACIQPPLFDRWNLHYDTFQLELHNEYNQLGVEFTEGKISHNLYGETVLYLHSELKHCSYYVTIAFEDGEYFVIRNQIIPHD